VEARDAPAAASVPADDAATPEASPPPAPEVEDREITLADLFPGMPDTQLSSAQLTELAESYRPDATTAPALFADVNAAPRVIDERIAYLVQDAMRAVIRRGTGIRAWRALGRSDLSGKTGTSNDGRDAWFAGFNTELVAVVWVGYDDHTPLGPREEGSRTALPIWNVFMKDAVAGMPLSQMPMPQEMETVRINRATGCPATSADPFEDVMFEVFRVENVPECDTADEPTDVFNTFDDFSPSRDEEEEAEEDEDPIF
jgi:penicillin-binding protein 1A